LVLGWILPDPPRPSAARRESSHDICGQPVVPAPQTTCRTHARAGSTEHSAGPTLGRDRMRLSVPYTALIAIASAAVVVGCGSSDRGAGPAPAAAPTPSSPGGGSPPSNPGPSPDPAAEREPARDRGVVATLHDYSQAVRSRDAGRLEPLVASTIRRRRSVGTACIASAGRSEVLADFVSEFETSSASTAPSVDRRQIRTSGDRADVVLDPPAQSLRRVHLVRRSGRWLIDRLDGGCRAPAASAPRPVRRAPHRTGPGDGDAGVVHPEPDCAVATPPPGVKRPSRAQLRDLCAAARQRR
jgi:hypothetical protein